MNAITTEPPIQAAEIQSENPEISRRISAYRDAQLEVAKLKAMQQEMAKNLAEAKQELTEAEHAVKTAKARKSKAFSIADMTTATRDHEQACSRCTDAAALIENISNTLDGLPEKEYQAHTRQGMALQAIYVAQADEMIARLKASNEFGVVRDAIEKAYVAKVIKGGFHGGTFDRFAGTILGGHEEQTIPKDTLQGHINKVTLELGLE